MKHTKFEVFQDKAGEYRWYLRANNNEIIADSSEGYVNKKSALHGIELIRELNPKTTTFEDLTAEGESTVEGPEPTTTKFEVFQDKGGEYRWYLKARNGEIIADSSEGYVNKKSALHGIELIQELNPKTVTFEDLTTKPAAAATAAAEATAVASMTAEPAPTETVTPAPPAEAPMATGVAAEAAVDTRVRSSVIILVVAAVIIIGIIATGFALGIL